MRRSDRKLVDALLKHSIRYRRRLVLLEDGVKDALVGVFAPGLERKRDIVLGHMSRLTLDPAGVIEKSPHNRGVLLAMLADLKRAQAATRGRADAVMGRGYKTAAKRGVLKALDTVKIADPVRLPRAGYKGANPVKLVSGARRMMFDLMYTTDETDLGVLRRTFNEHILNPQGTLDTLRRDIAKSGQIDAMRDSLGRRITVDERADRIARYEMAELAQKSHDEAIGEFYFDGEYDPAAVYYLHQAVMDTRTSPSHERRHGHVMTAEEWEEYDWGDGQYGLAPLRPRCRCDSIFVMPHWFARGSQERKAFNPNGPRMAAAA